MQASNPVPVIGNWYQDREQGNIFKVVAYDEDDQAIEIQYLDGEVEEYDLGTWSELPITDIAAPEDWRSGFELSQEDAEDPDDPIRPDEWSDTVDQLESAEPDIEDDWNE